MKKLLAADKTYTEINNEAAKISIGSDGLFVLPFGNGAERIFNNQTIGAHYHNIDFNLHKPAHIFRAVQEGIAFSFRYGLDIMKENGITPTVIRAGKANLFLSPVFTEAFVNILNVPVELYDCDGSIGAATGAGMGAGINSVGNKNKPLSVIEPQTNKVITYENEYAAWKKLLNKFL
jgi:xylulokinase